jgi:hypothetical protein
MAKKRKGKTTHKWQPRANDAINLATIRWFALTIEAMAIEVYGTNPAVFSRLEAALRECVGTVAAIDPKRPIADDTDCPPGWVPCAGECAPMCMES